MIFGTDKAYCLCLDKREEHWLNLQEQCESKGIKFCRFLVGGGELFPEEEYDHVDISVPEQLRNPSGWIYGGNPQLDTLEMMISKKTHHYNAFLSHKKMAKKALNDGYKNVLFLEDDAYFTDRFDEVVLQLEDYIAALDYDMLFLGWWMGTEEDDFNESLEKIWREKNQAGVGKAVNTSGFHGVILRERILELIANELEPIEPVDAQLNKRFNDKIQSYCVAPKIIHDKGIFSYCEQTTIKRLKL